MMRSKTHQQLAIPLLLTLGAFVAPASAATILTTPAGLNPGDPFRFVFLTSGTITATSPDVATYDTFATNEAAAADLQYNGNAIIWQYLGSSAAQQAIERVPNDSPPIFRIDGLKIADNGFDLWDGSIAAPLNITQYFETKNSASVWTATFANGARRIVSLPGTFGPGVGLSSATDSQWIIATSQFNEYPAHVYAVSEVLHVAPVPEPSTFLLFGAGSVLLLIRRRHHPRTKGSGTSQFKIRDGSFETLVGPLCARILNSDVPDPTVFDVPEPGSRAVFSRIG